MTDSSQYKRAKDPRKKQPVKRVAISDEARKAYEEMIQQRDQKDREYGVHLGQSEKR